MKYRDSEGDQTSTDKISVPLSVAIGMFVVVAGLCAGGFGTSIWWASSISTKMDVLVKQGAEQSAMTTANASRITALELWQRQIDTVGSPAMARRVEAMEKDIIKIGEDLRLHKATTANRPQQPARTQKPP